MSLKKKILLVIVFILFGLSIFFTVIGNQFLIELFAPITIFSVFLLWSTILEGLGVHKYSAVFIGLAFLCLGIGDTIRFVNHYIVHTEPYSDVLRFIYVLPTLFFAINETIYFKRKLATRNRELSGVLVNTFTIAAIAIILIYKFFYRAAGDVSNFLELTYLVFIFLAFYVVLMCLFSFYIVGWDNLFKGPQLITISMLCYELMDIEYVYCQAIGVEPDDNLGDILYMLWIILMTIGMMLQVERKYYFEFRDTKYTRKKVKNHFTITIFAIIIVIALDYVGFFDGTEASNIIIVLLAYQIMKYLLYIGQINEEQNVILERKVREKTAELRKSNKQLEVLSSTDQLTGLYNRRYSGIFLNELAKDNNNRFALYLVDLNLFKPINDTYGHEMGDHVLEEYGRRMLALPEGYTSFRLGGDEFLICYELAQNEVNLTDSVEMIKELFSRPVYYETYVFNLSASIGVAVYPNDSKDIDELMTYADTAMYSVKSSKHQNGYKFFNKSLVQYISSGKIIREKLASADVNKDFVLYYQPQIDVKTGDIVGVEAFPHIKGDLETLSPSKIIPVAEEIGLMSRLGIWIVKDALTLISDWNRTYGKSITLTVNLSPLQLIDDDYAKALDKLIGDLNISPSIITLDIDNSVIMGAASSAKETLKEFRKKGFNLSLNDFGGGDINLFYVMECGFTGIKLSRSLISNEEVNSGARQMIDTIIAMASKMDIEVTAVGIES
ncbi:MAG: EAL domain-containing protein, partial [Lachnospiraceae bacterium]|nr:EAL domain-containing protein [Lachnospiraceae bacterium]